MNITIVGAGNIGTQFAVHCSEKGNNVIIFGSKPEYVCKDLVVVNESDEIIHSGTITCATRSNEIAFSNAELIFVTMPAFCMKEIADKIYPYVRNGMKICLVPGTGGGECAFKKCMEKGAVIFGLQRVPSVARLKEYGKVVCATGYRDKLYVASLPQRYSAECAELIEAIFDMPCGIMPNYLNLTLTPSNPVLHTTRLRKLFESYKSGVVYDRIPLFYEEWNDETSELLFLCDEEVQQLCRKLSEFDLSYVKSLKIHYESSTPHALTNKIRSIKGFKGLPSPQIKVENGYIPDLQSRYFTADFPFGLSILVQIAEFLELDTPNMKETLAWYYSLSGNYAEFHFLDYGITSLEAFLDFYRG